MHRLQRLAVVGIVLGVVALLGVGPSSAASNDHGLTRNQLEASIQQAHDAASNPSVHLPSSLKVAVSSGASSSKSGSAKATPLDVVTCSGYASTPVLNHITGSQYVISGGGFLTSCTPHAPDSCTITVWLQYYTAVVNTWSDATSGATTYGCPLPTRSASYGYGCLQKTQGYTYRTLMIASILYGGSTDTESATSSTMSAACI